MPNPWRDRLERYRNIVRNRGIRGFLSFVAQRLEVRLRGQLSYQGWIARQHLTPQQIAAAKAEIASWQHHPKFSVIMPVYNIEAVWLEKAIASVRQQIYPHWELCIADDASTAPHIRPLLERYRQLDDRIKVVFRSENGHISAASNSALAIATGDYIALLDHDDELTIEALFENAKLINQHPEADFIYSDEDIIDAKGRRFHPFFKPNWSPDYFHACMYTCHLGVYRTELIREIGGFRSEFDGAQDYDLVLRVVEKTQNIHHIPRILYHWRAIESSAASGAQAKPWAYVAGQKALQAMLDRSPFPGHVEPGPYLGSYRVRRDIVGDPLVSIIIPSAGTIGETTKGRVCLLENCIRSIQELSTYPNFEIVLVDGYDVPDPVLEAIAAPNVRLVRSAEPFNFSMRMNQGVAAAKGDFLLMLNDDVEVLTPDWLESMLELTQLPEVGSVGAKLVYPNGGLQHVGVMILDGNPGHAFYEFPGDHLGYFGSNVLNRNYWVVTAACLMMRRSVFEELQGFDETLPLNFNDVDLCLKAHQAGYRNVVTPFVKLIHYESASREKGLRPGEYEKLTNKWKPYFDRLGVDPYYNPNLAMNAPNFELG